MKRVIVPISIAIMLLIGLTTANAQDINDPTPPQSGYDLSWYTIAGGGATFSMSGSYSLGGTIGQPDAGMMSTGSYTLLGGFWSVAAINYNVYLPLVLKNN
jgi:hypothetical protein